MNSLEIFHTASTNSQTHISMNQQVSGHNRYYVYIDGITVGWVIRHPDSWLGVFKDGSFGLPLGHTKSRRKAIEMIIERLNEMAHIDDDFVLMA